MGRIANVKVLVTHILTVIKAAGRNGQKTVVLEARFGVKFLLGTFVR